MNGAWSSARCASGTYSASVRWSTSTPWRWLNVPRRVSWPARRTGVPPSTSEPNDSASASAQSISSCSNIVRRARSWRSSLGFTSKPSGQRVSPSSTRSRTVDRHRGRDRRIVGALGVVGCAREPGVVVVVGVGGAAGLGLLEGAVEAGLEVVLDGLLVVDADVAALHELLRVERAHRRVRVDELVHPRLRERGLVGLVVAVAAVADEVDDDVLLELVAELERQAHHAHRGLGVVAVHVEDRRLDHLGDVGGVHARPAELGRGGEPELVVHDDVDGAADLVAGHLGEVERLGHDALTRERGVAVQQHREHRATGAVGDGVADGARHALDHRADRLEVARVGGEREQHLVAVGRLVLADRAEVVLHVAGALRARRVELTLELAEDLRVRLADHVGEHVEPTAVRHAEHDVAHARVGARGCRARRASARASRRPRG